MQKSLQDDKLTMFQPKKGYPKLRGRAADIAGLHAAMLALWGAHMDPTDAHHRRVRLMLALNKQIQKLSDTHWKLSRHCKTTFDFHQMM